jgi:ornithine cyclodeaminase
MSEAPIFLSEAEVYRRLDYDGCIAAMREAMAILSSDEREQPLRQITPLGDGRMFGVMPGLLPGADAFGAKLVSVFPDPAAPGRSFHRGLVALFDGDTGEVVCVADAAAVTHVRTGCASAAATDALARHDSETLALFGYGAQAQSHLHAIARVRPIRRVGIWGRNPEAAASLAQEAADQLGVEARAWDDPAALASEADIVCTVTSSAEPILKKEWVRPGTHINAVGSSYAGPREIDNELVATSRFFVDYRRSALAAAAEFLSAKAEGLIGEDHILGEIGEVISGRVEGRRSPDDITLYKSLGHIAQDLAAVRYALSRSDPSRSS